MNNISDKNLENYASLVSQIQNFRSILVERKLNLIDEGSNELISSINRLALVNPLCFLALLNIREKRLSYLGNVTLKMLAISKSLAIKSGFNRQSQDVLSFVVLRYLYAITPVLIKHKTADKPIAGLFKLLRNGISRATKELINQKNDKLESGLVVNDVFEVLISLSSEGAKKYRYQTVQTIFKLSVEATFQCLPLTKARSINIDAAIQVAKVMPKIFDINVAQTTQISLPFSPRFISRFDNEKALLLSQSNKEDARWRICHLNDDLSLTEPLLISDVDDEKIRFEFTQPNIDGLNFESIAIELMANKKDKAFATLFNDSKNKSDKVPDYIWQLSKTILKSSNQVIVDTLQNSALQSRLIMSYAQQVNRQRLPVSDLSHAIAMLGVMRIFPVICLNEFNSLEKNEMTIDGPERIYRSKSFSNIARALSLLTKTDLAEYCELTARILSSTFSTNDSDEVWRKKSKIRAGDWQLPKLYLKALDSYFLIKLEQCQLSDLPKNVAQIVALFMLTEWMHNRIYVNDNRNAQGHVNTEYLNCIGVSIVEFDQLIYRVIDMVNPVTHFE